MALLSVGVLLLCCAVCYFIPLKCVLISVNVISSVAFLKYAKKWCYECVAVLRVMVLAVVLLSVVYVCVSVGSVTVVEVVVCVC